MLRCIRFKCFSSGEQRVVIRIIHFGISAAREPVGAAAPRVVFAREQAVLTDLVRYDAISSAAQSRARFCSASCLT